MLNRAAAFVGTVCIGIAGSGAAQAQPGDAVVNGATAAELISFFQAAEIRATDVTKPADVAGENKTRSLQVTMGEGAVFYVALRGCENAAATARCELIQPYVIFGSLNFPLARVNAYNYAESAISTMMMTDEGALILAAKFNMAGGATTRNLFTNVAVFVSDIGRAVESIQNAGSSGATISFSNDFAGVSGFGAPIPEDAKVNWIGKATKGVDPETVRRLKHLGGAE